jgi:hypothetical protein
MAAAGRDPVVTVGVVGAPSSGIELVLKQISLPVAQIRIICKNVPQVSMTNKMTFSPKGKCRFYLEMKLRKCPSQIPYDFAEILEFLSVHYCHGGWTSKNCFTNIKRKHIFS